MSLMLRDAFLALILDESFLRRVLLHSLNHRVQDFPDPLTTTLVLMATSPIQCSMCETGLLLFKTHLLPVVPFGLLRSDETARLRGLIEPLSSAELHETIESNGQFTLQLLPFSASRMTGRSSGSGSSSSTTATPTPKVCARKLLLVFVDALLSQTSTPVDVNRTLCNIVLQRFLSRVSTSSEVVNAVIARIGLESPPSTLSSSASASSSSSAAIIASSSSSSSSKKKRARTDTHNNDADYNKSS
jgi:hypothetical protein